MTQAAQLASIYTSLSCPGYLFLKGRLWAHDVNNNGQKKSGFTTNCRKMLSGDMKEPG